MASEPENRPAANPHRPMAWSGKSPIERFAEPTRHDLRIGVAAVETGSTNAPKRPENARGQPIDVAGSVSDAIGHDSSRMRQDELFSTISQRASNRLPLTSRQMTVPGGATPPG